MAKRPDLAERMKAMAEAKAAQKAAGAPEIAAVTRQTVEHETWEAAKPKVEPETPKAKASDLTAVARQTVEAMKRESVPTPARVHVSTFQAIDPAHVEKGFKVRRPRVEKPHQSVYAHPKVFDAIRAIAAAEYPKKPQDLYREGLRHVLAARGYDFDKLDNGEG